MPVTTRQTLFRDVRILDSTGAQPYPGDVLVENDRIVAVGAVDPAAAGDAAVVAGRGRTLMSGLCDAHTHFSWNNSADLVGLGTMPVEEHLLFCLESARTYIDSGYTMCLGAASAKDRLDVVCRDAINAGRFPGPRYLANGPEIAVTGGALIKSITKFADGPEGMRKAVRELIDLGVDQIKLSMTGEEITGTQRAEDTYFSDEEVAAAVTEAHRRGKRVCAHARSAESVKMCVRHGVDIVYHASFTDAEGMDMLEAAKDWIFVAPGINWLDRHSLRGVGVRLPAGGGRGRRLQARAGDRHRGPARDAPARDPDPARRRLRLRLDAARHVRPRPAALRRAARFHADGGDPLGHRARRRDHAAPGRTGQGRPRLPRRHDPGRRRSAGRHHGPAGPRPS